MQPPKAISTPNPGDLVKHDAERLVKDVETFVKHIDANRSGAASN